MFNDYATPRNTVNPLLEAPGFYKNIVSWLVRATFAAISSDDFSAYSHASNLTFIV